ncbi:hypothetical protein YC2023_077659 [Brassica napus]
MSTILSRSSNVFHMIPEEDLAPSTMLLTTRYSSSGSFVSMTGRSFTLKGGSSVTSSSNLES